ncbi:hypothetical protein PspLS_06407 [Pyricularia sp. CBS 133598]|nr:hypothetical protein PspLS_06407 [Pyricularia sp. CBS 133598]
MNNAGITDQCEPIGDRPRRLGPRYFTHLNGTYDSFRAVLEEMLQGAVYTASKHRLMGILKSIAAYYENKNIEIIKGLS